MSVRERPRLSAKRWAETADSGFTPTVVKLPEGINFFSPKKAGTYRLEIVPYVVPEKPKGGQNPNAQGGELHYERTFFSHRGIGADEKSYVCPAKTAGKPCPICEHRKELMRDKDADDDLIKALAPKQRQLWNIYDHGDSEKGVQVWEVSFHLFGKQLKAAVLNSDEDDKFEYFADPEDGMTLRVGMEEKSMGKGNPFLEAASITFKPRKEPLSKEILDAAQPLDDLLILIEYDKLKSIFLQEEGIEHAADEDDDDDDGRKVSKDLPFKKGTTKKSSQEEGSHGGKSSDDGDDRRPADKAADLAEEEAREDKALRQREKSKTVTAADLGIGKGDDCQFEGKTWTIIRVADDGLTVTLSNDDDEVKKGIKVSELQPPAGTAADSPKKDAAPPAEESGKKAGAHGGQGGSAAAQTASRSEDDDWDADFDDKPKKETKQEKQKDQPKEESKKETKPAKDDDDDWDF